MKHSKNVENNDWKIWAYEHMYTKKKVDKKVKKFIDYIYTKEVQQNLVKTLGYITIHDMKVQKDENGNIEEIQR